MNVERRVVLISFHFLPAAKAIGEQLVLAGGWCCWRPLNFRVIKSEKVKEGTTELKYKLSTYLLLRDLKVNPQSSAICFIERP